MSSENMGTNLDEHARAFREGPYSPSGAVEMPGIHSLSEMKQTLSSAQINSDINDRINTIVDDWSQGDRIVEPYIEMRNLLEEVRQIPPSIERVELMNSIVRSLGRPAVLATYLDMLRDSTLRDCTQEQAASKTKLQNVKMHSIYGWAGNTLLVETLDVPTEGTFKNPLPGLAERLGNSPNAWNLTVHIWQPNHNAKGFVVPELEEGSIHEPPHSHPFNFASTIVKGRMRQSIYKQSGDSFSPSDSKLPANYGHTTLEHVDSVWPPHYFREPVRLDTIEHKVELNEGDSYYMPCHWIHDVEIDSQTASSEPTISLFLSSEYLVLPHVYMSGAMADYHHNNPDIKRVGVPISEAAWHQKLRAIAAYLRNDSQTLRTNDIVGYEGEYAFFHRQTVM